MNTKFNMAVSSLSGGKITKDSKWGKAAIYMFGFWTIATSFVCFEKPDFLNLTIGIMGLFLFLDPQQIKQSYLRLLVMVMPLSEFYDGIWLYEKTSEYYEDQGENGMAQVILMAVDF